MEYRRVYSMEYYDSYHTSSLRAVSLYEAMY